MIWSTAWAGVRENLLGRNVGFRDRVLRRGQAWSAEGIDGDGSGTDRLGELMSSISWLKDIESCSRDNGPRTPSAGAVATGLDLRSPGESRVFQRNLGEVPTILCLRGIKRAPSHVAGVQSDGRGVIVEPPA